MEPDAPIRVLVGEDEPLVREGVVRVLESAGFDVVGVAGDADELICKAGGHHPDLVLTDIGGARPQQAYVKSSGAMSPAQLRPLVAGLAAIDGSARRARRCFPRSPPR